MTIQTFLVDGLQVHGSGKIMSLSLNNRENPGHASGIINASSTILEAFFFTVELWELLVQETIAYAARTTPSGWYDTC